jgi:hypothetical protein
MARASKSIILWAVSIAVSGIVKGIFWVLASQRAFMFMEKLAVLFSALDMGRWTFAETRDVFVRDYHRARDPSDCGICFCDMV